MQNIELKELSIENNEEIVALSTLLNPKKTKQELTNYLNEMFQFDNYRCFGLYQNKTLVGVSGAWITVRMYSGKQLEIDHFVIDESIRSSGLGNTFISLIEEWSVKNDCKTIELNAYVQSDRAHKFYFKMGYKILGFHFQKKISNN
jgi:GNAT superfamily N-acetyltransferase